MAAVITSLILLVLGALASYGALGTAHFYAQALEHAHTDETVTVDNRPYRVLDGVAYTNGSPATGFAAARAVRLAYEVTLARRDPLFALPGVDPVVLKQQVDLLAQLTPQIAALQPTPESTKLAARLYPTEFLLRTAELEEARQRLRADPNEEAARAYRTLLVRTAYAKENAANDFAQAFSTATATSSERVALFSGVLNRTTARASLDVLLRDTTQQKERALARARCTLGVIDQCAALPTTSLAVSVPLAPPQPQTTADDVNALWDSAYNTPSVRTGVILAKSTCASDAPGPSRIVLGQQQNPTGVRIAIAYVDNLFLYKLSDLKRSPYATYMRQTFGSQYTPTNSFKFYVCQQVGVDYGAATAVAQVAAFAEAHPGLAPRERHTLLATGEYVAQWDAEAYLVAALRQSDVDTSTHHNLEELALMARTKVAGLEEILKDVVGIMDADTRPPLSRVLNNSISYLFLTHSAFPTLLRIGASDDSFLDALYIKDAEASRALMSQLVDYRQAREQTSTATVVQDLRSFLIAENKIASTTPSATPPSTRPMEVPTP
jgi:hypothetical protein